MSDLLTAAQAAELLHLNVKRVQSLARAGRLPAVRTGRKWLFPRQQLLRALRGPAAEGVRGGPATGVAAAGGVDISARNQLRGRVVALHVDGVMAEVHVAIGEQTLVSVITRGSVERLGLREGDEVLAVIKSTEVMIAKPAGAT